MKDYAEINRYKGLGADIDRVLKDCYDRGYDRGYASAVADERTEGIIEGLERDDIESACKEAVRDFRYALLDKSYLKSNYGTTRIRSIIKDFEPEQIIAEHCEWLAEREYADAPRPQKVCHLVGCLCPYEGKCDDCEVYNAVQKMIKEGDAE